MRTLQPHAQPPAFSRLRCGSLGACRERLGRRPVPGEPDALRQSRGVARRLWLEFEAHDAFTDARQADDETRQREIAPFQRRQEPILETQLRLRGGPEETRGEGGEHGKPTQPGVSYNFV